MALQIKNNLEAWYQSTATTGNLSLIDLSGKGRTITQNTTPPVIQANVQNGKQSIYFDGTKNPLSYTGALTARHIFILASYDDANFGADYKGLLSDIASNGILVGNTSSSTLFTDFSYSSFGIYSYRKSDVFYADNNQVAPVNGQIAILEVTYSAGWTLDGIQIGRDRGFSTRKWKGHFLELLAYSSVQDEFSRESIFRHFAEEWHLWRQTSAGLPVFPFPAEHSRSMTPEQQVYLSQPYTGDPVALVRGDAKKTFDFTFESRRSTEYLAADAFNVELFPLGKWVYRDYSFYPARDTTLRFTSNVKEQGVGRFKSYAFTAKQV